MNDPLIWFILGAVTARTIDAFRTEWKDRNK